LAIADSILGAAKRSAVLFSFESACYGKSAFPNPHFIRPVGELLASYSLPVCGSSTSSSPFPSSFLESVFVRSARPALLLLDSEWSSETRFANARTLGFVQIASFTQCTPSPLGTLRDATTRSRFATSSPSMIRPPLARRYPKHYRHRPLRLWEFLHRLFALFGNFAVAERRTLLSTS